jgi:hypothetical protein
VNAVVSDTSPLHYLIECEAVGILPVMFREVLIPPTVHRELQHERTPPLVRVWAQSPPYWIKIQAPAVLDTTLNVDDGEREAICLAREIKAVVILIDDRKGRAEAVRCGLRVTGTIGFASTIQRLRKTGARLDEELIQAALRRNLTR